MQAQAERTKSKHTNKYLKKQKQTELQTKQKVNLEKKTQSK